ncbi:MAG: gliding motility-associated C-terminal domain-containing protein [Burkholderiales bacterium]|nr:gliding motility-associated C-terminal domain-containing protein [Bacteroidia bacterium]
MNSILRYFSSIILGALFLNPVLLIAQGVSNSSSSWAKKFEYQKSFIENKGQFIIPASFGNPSEVLFAVDHGGTKIYFTKKGISYSFLESTKKKKDEREMERERREEFNDPESHARFEKEEHELKVKSDQVTMLWQNASSDVELESSELTSDYHSYYFKQSNGEYKNATNIKGFKKITYKNIYPNIDIDYVFSEKDGLKYSLTLHPGADPSLVKMVYNSHVTLKNNGDAYIDTKFGDIIDHAPLTFYQGNSSSVITSTFIKTGKTISFQLDNYDNTKTVVIDPWTQTPAFASNWDCVWECERDGAGNVYIIGGVTPLQLLKYNSAGAIQWTYNTPYDTTSWLGTFATDNVGNSYVTNGTSPGIQKVNTAGALQWSVGGGSLLEYWNIAFNCDQTKLIVGGTDNLRGAIFDINTTNGAVLTTKIVAYGSAFGFPPSIQEVRSITSCGNGKYYFLTLDSIGFINQNLSSCGSSSGLFKTTSTHGFSYKCENYRNDNTGIMAIRADINFVYTHNGTTLFKRSLGNASIISSVAIPGGAATTSLGQKVVSCSGIDIDAAGNIYVGSTNAVTKFSPALVQLATAAVPFNVYDVHVSAGGDVIACGSTGNSGTASRTGYVQLISSLTAGSTLSLTCCDANICQPTNVCTTASAFNLTAATVGGAWSGTGITNGATGTFNPATAGVGSHVITYSLACGVGTTTITVSSCGTVSLCINSGSLTVIGGASTYTWASTTTSLNCSGCFGGTCSFLCPGVTVPTWTASGITVAAPSSTVFPIKVKDLSSGITYTFNTLASIPACTTTACPTLTLAVTSQTNVNCFGASTGTASVNTSGGVGPYTYTWSPGNLNGASQSALAAGTYTIAIKDANLCTGTGILTITQPTSALNAVISSTTAAGCGSSTGGATVTTSGGTAGYTYNWAPSGGTTPGVSNLSAGNNTVTVTDNKGCFITAVANISTSGGPALSVTSQTNVNCFGANTGTATVNASGGTGPYSYTWTPGNLTGASQTTLGAGTYTINVKDVNLCAGSGTLTITQPTSAVSAIITATTAASCGSGTTTVVFWTEDFGAGCNQGNLASAYTGTNGAWATTAMGTNDPEANEFFVSAMENGNAAGTCGAACGSDRSLHVGNVAAPILGLTADNGAAYNAGGACGTFFCVATDRRAESPSINCAGQSNITLNFNYLEFGDAANDDASLFYFNGTVWAPLFNLSKTLCCGGATCNGSLQALWTAYNISLPASANNNPNVKIGFRWVNNDDGVGTDPSFAVDDITLTTAGGAGGTGGATVTANGGTPGYNYSWSPSGGSTAGVTGLNAGNNTVTVTDATGCIATAVANITSTGGPTLSVTSQTNVNCFGASTGTATVNGSGGTGPYSYTWTPGNLTGASQTTLSAGIYTINVSDGNSCVGSGTLSITQPTAAASAVISATSAAGCGASTGGATVTASGGTPSYTFSWVPSGGTTAGVSNLASGGNTVTVTDSKGCTVTAVANITTAGGPTLSVTSQTNVNCFGANTGTATVNAGGGTGPYSYTWSPGNLSGAGQSALSAGTYTINVTDGSLCAGSGTVLITQPVASLSGVFSNTIAGGCGASNGSASVTPSGGTGPYTYSWGPNGGSASSASNLASGMNSVLITDTKGCSLTLSLTLNSTSGPTLSIVSQTNVNCFGASTGTATVNASGGTGPFTYTWMPGNLSGASNSALAAGVYTINASNSAACIGSGTLSITQPTVGLSALISNSPTGCGTSVGSATVNAGGGTPSYTYSWSSPGGSATTISNLSAGNYSVTVTDSKGCQTTSVTTINSSAGGPTLSISSQTNLNCNGASNGAAAINASGPGGPFTYTWSPLGGNATSASGLSAGVYTVFVGYGTSCVNTITVSISQPAAINLSLTTTPASCGAFDGTATVLATGGNGALSILWSVNSNNATVGGLSAGVYSVVVTDASSCSVSSICVVSSSGTLGVNAGGSTTIYSGESTGITANVPSGSTVVWSPSVSLSCSTCVSSIASPTITTTYTVTASSGGCTGVDTVTIFVDIKCGELFIPSAFSPNDDGQNDMLFVMGNCIKNMEFVIFDRWGEKVFVSNDPAFGWDGTFNGKKLDPAAFAFYLKATVDGKDVVQKGSISIVK